jgi:hypothetical protein
MAFLPKSTSGRYKTENNYFPVNPQRINNGQEYQSIPSYSVDIVGIREFLLHWFSNNEEPVHMLSFTARDEKLFATKTMFVILKDVSKESSFLWKIMTNYQRTHLTLDLEDTITKMIPLMEDYHYNFRITSMFGISKKDEVSAKTHEKMTLIINDFQKAIIRAHSNDEKITAIVTHVQHIAQLHPFKDGNIRSCYVLINKLLRDYDLPLTILSNPNRLDCCSVATNVAMVKLGQIFYKQLLQHKQGSLLFKMPEETPEEIIINPQPLADIDSQLVESFINNVLKNEPMKSFSNLLTDENFFSNQENILTTMRDQLNALIDGDKRYASIINAFNEGKYNLALRKACFGGSFEIIMFFLDAYDTLTIDHREPSSNNKTAVDWLLENKQITQNNRLTINDKFIALNSRCQMFCK